MKPNTRSRSVSCLRNGTLALLGVTEVGFTELGVVKRVATLMATSLRDVGVENLEARVNDEFPCGRCIVTEAPYNANYKTIVVFQQRFEGRIKNLKGFLKSLRNRLQLAIDNAALDSLPKSKEDALALAQEFAGRLS